MRVTHRIASGRATLATQVVGTGAPVVFLHANVCDSRMWGAQLDAVGVGFKAVAYDRRGFGETRADSEEFYPVADLMTVVDAVAGSEPAILVGCSQGGKIALDAALLRPDRVRALFLVAPGVGGAPEAVHAPEMKTLLAAQRTAEQSGDLARLNTVKARLWLDGPLAPEGRVTGEARRLFLEMNDIALRSPPTGTTLDVAPAYNRLGEIEMPSLVVWGDLDFPHVQERSRRTAATLPQGAGHELRGVAHLPSLERPADVTGLLLDFLDRRRDDRRQAAETRKRSNLPDVTGHAHVPAIRGGGRMPTELAEKSCTPCRGGIPPLTTEQAAEHRAQTPEWALLDEATRIERGFRFSSFAEAFGFVARAAELAEAEGHHPDISFGWGYARVSLRTKKIKGLHENDFIMAAKLDAIAEAPRGG